jgi:glycosyltransferase involved in cell wall biosynthesis
MEAMAMELPVIATNITGLPEIIDDGINGFLVPPRDPQALADKIVDLYNSQSKRTTFGKAARQTIEEKFNLKKNVARFEELLIQTHQE